MAALEWIRFIAGASFLLVGLAIVWNLCASQIL